MIVFLDVSTTIYRHFAHELNSVNAALSGRGLEPLKCKPFRKSFDSYMLNAEHYFTHEAEFSICSPGNSFGFMYGGFDQCIINAISNENKSPMVVCEKIQGEILKKSTSYLPVSQAISVDLPALFGTDSYHLTQLWKRLRVSRLIYCPTMAVPERLPAESTTPTLIFDCIWNILNVSNSNIIIPGFGTGVGGLDSKKAVKDMIAAILIHTIESNNELTKSLLVMFYLNKNCTAFGLNTETESMRSYLTDYGAAKVLNGNIAVHSWEDLLNSVKL
ncbi:hypothetical protein CLIB1423_01S06678 [[Candida] railenensis]|uniref:Macro-like domain-containing protein n=1 Tax=[Candida] railenensis TaxID=45579 RepID=A0A9P0QKU3_9ASCO|nr:hypothetical protein CLIB1423_01S06678 [[Candida] railenensis]